MDSSVEEGRHRLHVASAAPAEWSKASDGAAAVAPDGIAIHTFDLQGGAFTGIAEGRIPPGRFSIHRHLTLEQYTYVLAGSVTALVGDPGTTDLQSLSLREGDLLFSKPGASLEFTNPTTEIARVLFICSPPYPADDSDTRILRAHAEPRLDELADTQKRLETLRKVFIREIDQRLEEIRARLSAQPSTANPNAENV